MPLSRSRFQRLGSFGGKVAMVLVRIDSGIDAIEIEFRVELRGVHVVTHTEGLDRAANRRCEVNDIGGQ